MKRDRLLIILSLSIGTALFACMLSSTYAVLIDPLPFPQANRIVCVNTVQDASRLSSSLPDYDDLSRIGGPLEHSVYVASVFGTEVEIDGHPEGVNSVRFEGDILSVFGRAPVLGDPSDLSNSRLRDTPAAILSYPAWVRFFGKDPQALGKIIRIGASVYEVRAVLPPEYQMAMPADIWLATSRPKIVNRGNRDGKIYARLAPGNSVAAANAWLAPVAASLQKQAPKTNEGVTFESRLLRDSLMGDSKLLLYLLMSGAAIVLCVAYFNVYQLLAAEAALASSRWGIRIALGASRKRLFRDMLQEPLRLSLAGCTLGLLLSIGGMQMLRDLSPAEIPRIGDTRLIWQVALALFVLSTAAAGLFTVLMFFRTVAFEVDILGALRGGGQHGTSIRHALSVKRQVVLVAQITLSTALLISTGMVALALRQAVSSRLGFYPEGVLVTDLDLKEPANTAAGSQYVRDLMQRLSLLSGVETAAATSSVPFEGNSYTATFNANDTGGGRELQFAAVSPEFFHTMGITVLRGRTFSGLDSKDSPRVAILNQAAAQTLFGVGQSLNREMKGDVGTGTSTMQVIGLVENIRQDPTTIVAPPIVYLPLAQVDASSISLLVRADSHIGAEIKSQIWTVNPNQTVPMPTRLADLIDSSLRRIRYMAFLMTLFAATTMLLSAMGIYAAVAHWLSTSQREIALCIALGAPYSEIRSHILKRVIAITGLALAIGLIVAVAASNTMKAFFYGVQPQPGLAFVFATLLLGGTALLSSYIPALRSKFIDPAELLRGE